MEQQKPKIKKIIILPGNGCGDIENANWYAWMRDQLQAKVKKENINIEVILKSMPDPNIARKSIWIPFIRDQLKADNETLLIGHSSGAEAVMRYLETYQAAGAVLVSACYTDLGNKYEKQSGYYDDPWEWEKIKNNAQTIIQFHSKDDPLVPLKEGQFVAQSLKSEYHELDGKLHFFTDEDCAEILKRIEQLIDDNNK